LLVVVVVKYHEQMIYEEQELEAWLRPRRKHFDGDEEDG